MGTRDTSFGGLAGDPATPPVDEPVTDAPAPPDEPTPPTPAPEPTGDVAGSGDIPVDDDGRQIAQPELIDDGELKPAAQAAEELAAKEDEAIKVAQDSGRETLAD